MSGVVVDEDGGVVEWGTPSEEFGLPPGGVVYEAPGSHTPYTAIYRRALTAAERKSIEEEITRRLAGL